MNDTRKLLEGTTPGPWRWFANAKHKQVYLATPDRGRVFVMQFDRAGMQGAQPTGQLPEGVMVPLFDAPERYGTEPDHNGDFEITHPDFALIAAAPELAARLASVEGERDRLRALLDGAIDGHHYPHAFWQRYADATGETLYHNEYGVDDSPEHPDQEPDYVPSSTDL